MQPAGRAQKAYSYVIITDYHLFQAVIPKIRPLVGGLFGSLFYLEYFRKVSLVYYPTGNCPTALQVDTKSDNSLRGFSGCPSTRKNDCWLKLGMF
jgi:hypothetical protein